VNALAALIVLFAAGCASTPRAREADRPDLGSTATAPAGTIHTEALAAAMNTPPASRHASYADAMKAALERRRLLAEEYADSRGQSRRRILADAEDELYRALVEDLFSFWMGTPWGFNGTTQNPGSGKIACGYFVTTVLRDAGFKVERAKLAQQASEYIILSLTHEKLIKRFRNVPIADFIAAVKKMGRGIYIVGLDSHVGFLVCDGKDLRFIHSSSLKPSCVVNESADDSASLRVSKYRVVGSITADRALLWKWLTGVPVATHTK
jgi:hypothetical protein